MGRQPAACTWDEALQASAARLQRIQTQGAGSEDATSLTIVKGKTFLKEK